MDKKQAAQQLAKHGRYGDNRLLHVSQEEVDGLASLLPGGRLPINPETGLPEAFFFLPLLASMAAAPFTAGLSTALGAGAGMAASGLGAAGTAAAETAATAVPTAAATAAETAAAAAPTVAATTAPAATATGIGSLAESAANSGLVTGVNAASPAVQATTGGVQLASAGSAIPASALPPAQAAVAPAVQATAPSTLAGSAANSGINTAVQASSPAIQATGPTTQVADLSGAAAPVDPMHVPAGTEAIKAPAVTSPGPAAGYQNTMPAPPNTPEAVKAATTYPAGPTAGDGVNKGIGSLFGNMDLGKALQYGAIGSMVLPSLFNKSGSKDAPAKTKAQIGAKDFSLGSQAASPTGGAGGGTGPEFNYFPQAHYYAEGGEINPPTQYFARGGGVMHRRGPHMTMPRAGGNTGAPPGSMAAPMGPPPMGPPAGGPPIGSPMDGGPPVGTPDGNSFARGGIASLPPPPNPMAQARSAMSGALLSQRFQKARAGNYTYGPPLPMSGGTNFATSPAMIPGSPKFAKGGLASLTQSNKAQSKSSDADSQLLDQTVAALSGQTPNGQAIIQQFVSEFGQPALQHLMTMIGQQGGGQQAMQAVNPQAAMQMQMMQQMAGQGQQPVGDGLSDSIPAQISSPQQPAQPQPAQLSEGEYIVPSDVVSHLGNGSTQAGAKQLQGMVSKSRAARGAPSSGPSRIDPAAVMPQIPQGGQQPRQMQQPPQPQQQGYAKGGDVKRIPVPIPRPVIAMDYPTSAYLPQAAIAANPLNHPGQDPNTVPYMDENGDIGSYGSYIPSSSAYALTGNPWASDRQVGEQLRIRGAAPQTGADWLGYAKGGQVKDPPIPIPRPVYGMDYPVGPMSQPFYGMAPPMQPMPPSRADAYAQMPINQAAIQRGQDWLNSIPQAVQPAGPAAAPLDTERGQWNQGMAGLLGTSMTPGTYLMEGASGDQDRARMANLEMYKELGRQQIMRATNP